MGGCAGDVLVTPPLGLPRWTWWDTVQPPRIAGANYYTCWLPPIPTGMGAFLAEVCGGFRWGVWSSSLPRRGMRRWSEDGEGGGGEEMKEKEKWSYPDVVVVGGVNLTDERRGDLNHRNGVGDVLNLTLLQL